jgi:hypothetical protein
MACCYHQRVHHRGIRFTRPRSGAASRTTLAKNISCCRFQPKLARKPAKHRVKSTQRPPTDAMTSLSAIDSSQDQFTSEFAIFDSDDFLSYAAAAP